MGGAGSGTVTPMTPLQAVQEQFEGYDPGSKRKPLGPYAVLTSTFAIGFGAAVATAHRRRGGLPQRYSVLDIVATGIATHKLSRIVSKEGVTTPLRAPFTEFEGEAGSAEVHERPKHGLAHVPGELLTCPFCLAPWIATGYVAGLVLAPGPTRAWAAVFATVAGSDALQHAYARLRSG